MKNLAQISADGTFYHVGRVPDHCRLSPLDMKRPEINVPQHVIDALPLGEPIKIMFTEGRAPSRIMEGHLWSVERFVFEATMELK